MNVAHATLVLVLFLVPGVESINKGYKVKKLRIYGGKLVVDGEAAPVMYFEEGL
jgi:hypothetical protein